MRADDVFRSLVALAVTIASGQLLMERLQAQETAVPASISAPRTADGKPDLTGFWAPTPRDPTVADSDGNLTREFPSRRCGPNQVKCDIRTNQSADGQLVDRWNPNRPLYKPEYWDRIQELDANTNFVDPMMRCQPMGVPRMGPPTKIIQTSTEVFLFYAQPPAFTAPQDFRIVPIDGRKHAPDAAKDWTYYGRSVGYWEGDTLVVDSVGFNDVTWLSTGSENNRYVGGGYFHSDQIRVLERFRRDGDVLRYQVTVEDPIVLLEPWIMTPRQLRLNTDPNAHIPEGSPCKDVDSANMTLKVRH
jgi:hypothetical protein